MRGPSAAYQLANSRLAEGLEAFVLERRRAGQSWRRISIELLQNHQVDVSGESLRGWFKDRVDSAA